MSDADFANEMTGRMLIDPEGTQYVVIDFSCRSDPNALTAEIVRVEDGLLIGPALQIDSIAGWMVGNPITICAGY